MIATTKKRPTTKATTAKKAAAPTTIALADLPRIGAPLAGGTFAGIVRGDKAGDIAIVDLGYSAKDMTFEKAQQWAESDGGVSPDRAEARVLWANLDLHDEKRPSAWFWTRTPYAGYDDYAWCQDFSSGDQYGTRKSNVLRARAVRRLVIQ